MDLGLDILKLNGRMAKPLTPRVVRPLTEADLALLTVERNTQKPSPIQKLTSRHHALARALASGMKDWEAASVTGYTLSRISILKSDPTFKELMEFHRMDRDEVGRVAQKQMIGMLSDALDALQDRLENGDLSAGQELELMRTLADRTGNGPATTSTHNHVHTVNVADRMNAARKRLEERKIIDITPEQEEDAA